MLYFIYTCGVSTVFGSKGRRERLYSITSRINLEKYFELYFEQIRIMWRKLSVCSTCLSVKCKNTQHALTFLFVCSAHISVLQIFGWLLFWVQVQMINPSLLNPVFFRIYIRFWLLCFNYLAPQSQNKRPFLMIRTIPFSVEDKLVSVCVFVADISVQSLKRYMFILQSLKDIPIFVYCQGGAPPHPL